VNSSAAPQFQPGNLASLVRNLDLGFHWLADRPQFWFRREEEQGASYVLVDAPSGESRTLLESAWLQGALDAVRPEALRGSAAIVRDIDFLDDSHVRVAGPGEAFTVDLKARSCSAWQGPVSTVGRSSPDGGHCISRRGYDLWLEMAGSGAARRLTEDGANGFAYGAILDPAFDREQVQRGRTGADIPVQGVIWSPDGRHVLALRQDLRAFEDRLYVADLVPPEGREPRAHSRRYRRAGEDRKISTELAMFDIARGSSRRAILPHDAFEDYALILFAAGIVWWTADEVALLTANRGGTRYALVAVSLTSGRSRTILSEAHEVNVRLNPSDYNRPNVHLLSSAPEVVWYSERSGQGHLSLHDVTSGALIRELTGGDWVVHDLLRVDELDRLAYFTGGGREGGNPYYRYLYRVSLDGGEPQLLTPEPADHRFNNFYGIFSVRGLAGDGVQAGSSISPCGRYFVDSFSTIDQPPNYVLRRTDGSLVASLLSADAGPLKATGWRPAEPVVAKASDGKTDLHGVIVLPRGFDSKQAYPVVDAMYPGPQGSFAPRGFADQLLGTIDYLQTLADAGFAVVAIDGRGTAHRSRIFRDAFLGSDDPFGAADHVAALTDLAASRSYMDLSRLGVRGRSYGGYGALRAMLLFPDFFKAGVCATGPEGWLDFPSGVNVERFFGVPAPGSPLADRYARLSNVSLVDALAGPLLLIYGGIDENVPLRHGFVLIDALIAADKDFDLIILPNSGHAVAKDPYVVRRTNAFFSKHLRPETPALATGS
jgi:dipeptidyl aminopeptidase/acylaminoacyl peptidase